MAATWPALSMTEGSSHSTADPIRVFLPSNRGKARRLNTLPDMEIDALRWLLACRAPGVVAVMPDLAGDGRIEPLLAYYDDNCAHLLEAMASNGQRRMNRLRAAAGVITPQPPAHLRGSWRNVNTPEELGAGQVTP